MRTVTEVAAVLAANRKRGDAVFMVSIFNETHSQERRARKLMISASSQFEI
jgi:hypothetical protein